MAIEHSIYALCYPNGTPFYIGDSAKLDLRIQTHRSEAKSRLNPSDKDLTLRALWANGSDFSVKVLFTIENAATAVHVEELSILGFDGKLTNRHKCPPHKRNRPLVPSRSAGIPLDAVDYAGRRIWDVQLCNRSRAVKYLEKAIERTLDSVAQSVNSEDQFFAKAKLQLLRRDYSRIDVLTSPDIPSIVRQDTNRIVAERVTDLKQKLQRLDKALANLNGYRQTILKEYFLYDKIQDNDYWTLPEFINTDNHK